jgi:uncharacterized protein DUF1761
MTVNYLAVAVAAVAAWLLGAAWYTLLAPPWMAAIGVTPEQMQERKARPYAFLPFVYAFLALLVMAWVLSGVMVHIGAATIRAGVISGAFCWLGFVITTMVVNNSFAMRNPRLLLIDGGHWLAVLMLQGAILAAMR